MKKRGLVQYAPEYILYSHALVRANIFCIILKKKKSKDRSVDDSYLWNSTKRTRDYYHTAQKQLQPTLLQSQ